MNAVTEFFQQVANMHLSDYLDIGIVAYLLYRLFPYLRSTSTMRVFKTVVAFMVIYWVTDLLELHSINYILSQFLQVGLIALVVLFQPELRRMLDHLGSMKLRRLLGMEKQNQEMAPIISQTVQACEVMSREKVGALIVFARDNRLEEYSKTGTAIEGQVSEQLIRNIFFPKAALHDGAVIIREGKVAAAGCLLPLSNSNRISADLGTRHRAGVGMSEAADAVVVIVSEETGTISVAVGGMLKRHLAPKTLERLLRHELCPDAQGADQSLALKLKQKLLKDKEESKK